MDRRQGAVPNLFWRGIDMERLRVDQSRSFVSLPLPENVDISEPHSYRLVAGSSCAVERLPILTGQSLSTGLPFLFSLTSLPNKLVLVVASLAALALPASSNRPKHVTICAGTSAKTASCGETCMLGC